MAIAILAMATMGILERMWAKLLKCISCKALMGTLSRSNWNLEKYGSFLREGETGVPREKILSATTRTNNKLNPHVTLSPGIKPGPDWYCAIPAYQSNC